MEEFISQAVGFVSSADVTIMLYGTAILAVLYGLKKVADLTKTDKDNKAIDKAISVVTKVMSFFGKNKTKTETK